MSVQSFILEAVDRWDNLFRSSEEKKLFPDKGVSLRLDLTDYCIGCDHCYADGSPNGNLITDQELDKVILTVLGLTGRYDNESFDVMHNIHLGRTDVLYPGTEDELFEKVTKLLGAMKQEGITNTRFILYSSGKLLQSHEGKFRNMVADYLDLFKDFFGSTIDVVTNIDFLITTDDTFHSKKLSRSYAIEADEIFRKERIALTGATTHIPMSNAYLPGGYGQIGIFAATKRAQAYVDKNNFPVIPTCNITGVQYKIRPKNTGSSMSGRLHTLTLTKDGYVNLCCVGLSPIAETGADTYNQIRKNLKHNGALRSLLRRGPMGVVEFINDESLKSQAVVAHSRYGPCGICSLTKDYMRNSII
ncbi:MAG: hypothetical protein ABIJ08_04555 [Nanoarchaeota archaeon]